MGSGNSYAISYKPQKHVDGTPPEDRPDVLLIGHWHRASHLLYGGSHVILAGTFENGDSAFGRAIGGDVALGGWILRYTLGSDGKLARFAPEWCSYPQTKMEWREAS
jgi:hypothetical protein